MTWIELYPRTDYYILHSNASLSALCVPAELKNVMCIPHLLRAVMQCACSVGVVHQNARSPLWDVVRSPISKSRSRSPVSKSRSRTPASKSRSASPKSKSRCPVAPLSSMLPS